MQQKAVPARKDTTNKRQGMPEKPLRLIFRRFAVAYEREQRRQKSTQQLRSRPLQELYNMRRSSKRRLLPSFVTPATQFAKQGAPRVLRVFRASGHAHFGKSKAEKNHKFPRNKVHNVSADPHVHRRHGMETGDCFHFTPLPIPQPKMIKLREKDVQQPHRVLC